MDLKICLKVSDFPKDSMDLHGPPRFERSEGKKIKRKRDKNMIIILFSIYIISLSTKKYKSKK